MHSERRLENKRMKVARQVELNCLDSGLCFNGETADMSDGGIRAHMERAPKPGSNILVRLFWDDEEPVESFGRVAWTTPLPAGGGINVGVMLGARDNDASREQPVKRTASRVVSRGVGDNFETKQTIAALPIPELLAPRSIAVRVGTDLRVSMNGEEGEASILEVGNVTPEGVLTLKLQLQSPALVLLAGNEPEEDGLDSTEWRSNPAQEFLEKAHRVLSPTAAKVGRGAKKVGALASPKLRAAWRKVPAPHRGRLLDAYDKLSCGRPMGWLRSLLSKPGPR